MFITSTELNSLPTSGTPWSRVATVAGASAGTPNLGNIDSIVQTKVLVQALAYARNGSGVGRTSIVNSILAVVGTETSTSQPLNPWRQIGTWIAAADLVDLIDSGFDSWVRTLADKVVPGQTNWNTLRKCAKDSGNNWGSYARPSLFAVGAWLKKRGLTTSGGQTGQSLMDEVTNYFKRWAGDTSVPNTFTASGSFASGWSNTGYPGSGGVINSGTPTSPGQLAGANSEDGSRGSTSPPLTGAGISYSMEAFDGALMMAILLHHQGKTDVWSWANSALRRHGQHIGSANFTASNHIYHHEPALLNHVYGIGLSIPTNDSYGGRAIPFCTDWFAETGSQFLKTAIVGDPGGGGAVIAPTVVFTVTASGQTVTLTDTSTAGSSAITRREITWGDGSPVQTLNPPTATATHTYSPTTTTTYTVRDTVYSADSSATLTHTVTVAGADGAPEAVLTLTPSRGSSPLTVTYDFTGSVDPDGDTITARRIDFGDGTVINPAANSGTHTYTDPSGNGATYTVTGTVTAGGLTSAAVVKTVSITSSAVSNITGKLYIAVGGQLYPVNPNEVLALATGAPVPAGTLPGTLIFRT
jgi:hypothetical protein